MHQFAVKGFATGKLAASSAWAGILASRALKAERIGLVTEYCPDGAIDFLLLQASIIACKLLPLPEMSTTMFFIQ
jgi:hypothetical protein